MCLRFESDPGILKLSERLAGNGAGVSASFSTSIFAQEQSKPANPQQASSTPVLDPSGLFTIDSNPTPPDQLFGAKHTGIYDNNPTVNGKRKAPTADEHFPESDFVHLNELPIHKRPRGDTRTGDEDDSFLREVEAQHKAKEEKRQNKTNKKRKRDSGDSFSGQPNGISQKAIGKRERKKLRKNPPQAKSKSAKGGKFFQGNSKKRGTTNGNTNGSSENNGHSKKKRKK